MISGGLRLVTRGLNSRQGEVSRELAVLEQLPAECIVEVMPVLQPDEEDRFEAVVVTLCNPPPPPPPIVVIAVDESSDEVISDRPSAEALFTMCLELLRLFNELEGDEATICDGVDDDVS